MTNAIHATIRGRVQGVGFRAWTRATAQDLGLTGWVRNRDDGSVEAVFEGDSESIDRVRAVLQDGPAHARVDDVTVRNVDPSQAVDFGIR